MPGKYDIVIIGSGLGGLVCGYILSKKGFKVAILEKNAQIGGCLQTFKRGGVKFDTGMHYIGSMEEGQILHRFWKYFGLTETVPLQRLNDDGFDVISLNGTQYKYASGYDNFINTLAKQFPNNTKDLEKYIKNIRDIADASPLYNLRKIQNNVFLEPDYIKTSINDFIAKATDNPVLQNVLAGNLPLYAGVKDKTPTYIHALITNFYIQSAYRIIGGSDQIAQSLATSIKKFGGEIFTNAEVNRCICNDEKVTAVELKNGNTVEAKYFISNIHPQVLLEKIESNLIRKAYRIRINGLQNTISNFSVYIKFKPNTTPYLNYNYYYYKNSDVWAGNDYNPEKWPEQFLFMHQCKEKNQQFAESAELIGYMHYNEVEKWANTTVGHRGESYETFKKYKAERMLQELELSFPGINSCIESFYTSTPLTYENYTNTKNGSMYGIIRDKNFPTQTLVSQRTKIPNLFMTGQNINSHGILGVTIGAVITCAEFLGLNEIIQEFYES
ncbi:MAG: NAD(P)/FAD-dependent oxidoreductase [Bacteroidales bacterium]|nr:NAD(P)/FAD-dependent oxidoreductase [Bacteroidales bacterium]